MRSDVVDRVADGLEVGQLVVGDLDAELSSACTAISTMDSESMSRSSTKDFSGVTSPGLTPGDLFDDLARGRPRISSFVIDFPFFFAVISNRRALYPYGSFPVRQGQITTCPA